MYFVRPVELEDLEQVHKLALKTGPGMTNFPKDISLLESKLRNSVNSFSINPTRPGAESYMFVLQSLENGQIVGTSEIHSKIGGFEPFYSYVVEKTLHKSKELNFEKEFEVLKLTMEHNGPSEICTLFIDPDFRGKGLGRLMSLSRFLFLADNRKRFEDVMIADMRGVIDKKGYSPFWEHVLSHFFEMDYNKADLLSATDKKFIADLMPKHPIYTQILPEEVKEVIGKVNEATEPDLKFLYQEGFRFDGHVDIFDAGPRLDCKVDDIRTIKESTVSKIINVVKDTKLHIPGDGDLRKVDKSKLYILSNMQNEFRAKIEILESQPGDTIDISYKAAKALDLKPEDKIRSSPLFPKKKSGDKEGADQLIRKPASYSI